MIRVRNAVVEDLPVLLGLGRHMRNESIARFPLIDAARVQKQLDMAASMPDVFLVALAEDDGLPVGMVTAVAGDYAFSTERRAVSDLLFVVPERRGSTAAHRLVRWFNAWASGVGAETAIVGLSTGVKPASTGRFLERMGFEPLGMMYRKGLG